MRLLLQSAAVFTADVEASSTDATDVDDQSVAVYAEHSNAVFVLDVHAELVASGSQDDTAHVWRANSGKRVSVLISCVFAK